MKSKDNNKNNHTNSENELSHVQTSMSTDETTPAQKDGFRYDYDDSSDV